MNDLELLPPWAVGRATSRMTIGAQLCTKDGRRCGNAVTIASGKGMATVRTDMGTIMRLTKRELEELFHKPTWRMGVDEHLAKLKAGAP